MTAAMFQCRGDAILIPDAETVLVFGLKSRRLIRVRHEELDATVQSLMKQGLMRQPTVRYTTDPKRAWKGFSSLLLLVTRQCNLACVYCYAKASPTGQRMPLPIAISAVDRYCSGNPKHPSVGFHGGGEPSLHQELIRAVMARAQERLPCAKWHFGIVTNGTLGPVFLDWLVENRVRITLSWDGPPEIQNRNRPTASGQPSSDQVEKAARHLSRHSYPFTVRSTVSSDENVEGLVDFLAEYGASHIKLEPLFPHGRGYDAVRYDGVNQPLRPPEAAELVGLMLRALDRAHLRKVRLSSTSFIDDGLPMAHGNVFCQSASGRAMVVTQEGSLTACTEVLDADDEAAVPFHFGRLGQDGLELDDSNLNLLLSRHVKNIPQCRQCFARLACGGGCAIKAFRSSGFIRGIDWNNCAYTQLLIPQLILRAARMRGI